MSDEIKAAVSRLELMLSKNAEDVKGFAEKASNEIKAQGALTADTNGKLTEVMAKAKDLSEQLAETKQRLLNVEQSATRRSAQEDAPKTAGDVVVASDEYKSVMGDPHARVMRSVQVKSFHKTAIVNASGQNQPLVSADRRAGIVTPGLRRLTVRDLLPVVRTSSNSIEFAKENSFTNNAAPQYSSPNHENVSKAESALTFTLENEPVRTLAHWIPASRQVLSDAGMLAGYINGRLTYGLKLVEEDQLLNGDATGGNLNGLITQATAFDHGASGSTDTTIDTLLRAMNQCALSEFPATGIVLHPTDWTNIRLTKDANGNYIFGDPQSAEEARMWGLPVIATQSQTAGDFLVASFGLAAELYDREDATVRIAEQHAEFFVKNMVAILAEERLALVVIRPTSIIAGTFDA